MAPDALLVVGSRRGPERVSHVNHSYFGIAERQFSQVLPQSPHARVSSPSIMASSDFWLQGRTGTLSRKSQAQIWGLAKASEDYSLGLTQDDMAQTVERIGGGHPTQGAISKLLRAIEDDAEWYPGKGLDDMAAGGRKKEFTPLKQQAVANAAMPSEMQL